MLNAELGEILDVRHGFVIADIVLRDTLAEYATGATDAAELLVALHQHRLAYEEYLRTMYACVAVPSEA